MEDKSMDDAVTDFFHISSDPNYLIASSAEGKFLAGFGFPLELFQKR